MKMLPVTIVISVLFGVALASDEFSVLVSPKSLTFKGDEKLNSETLGDVFAASLGRSISGHSQWSGLYINDPFDLPENVVAVVVDGVDHLKFNDKVKTYGLSGSDGEDSLNALYRKVEVSDMDLNEGVGKIEDYDDGANKNRNVQKETTYLKPQLHSEDKLFLQQIAVLKSMSETIVNRGHFTPLTIIRFSIAPLRSVHGEKSPAVHEAEQLVTEALENLAETVNAAKINILVTAIAHNNKELLRHKRQAEQPKLNATDINVAVYYSEDYPVIFNIILWFMIVLAFSLLAISYAIATMDPGRDSIIYRMTSTRMKKDN